MADECVFSTHDMLDVARAGAADVVSLKLVKHGGLLGDARCRGGGRAAGIGLYGGCLLESSSVPRRICRSSPGCASWPGAASISARRS